MPYDVAVIGAGLAGLTAARALAACNDLSVVLIEGRGVGSNNPSPLTFADLTEEFDLPGCEKESYSSFTFHNYRGSSLEYLFADQPLIVLDYRKACKRLFQQFSASGSHVHVINEYVTSVNQHQAHVSLKLESGSEIEARTLIDAAGASRLTDDLSSNTARLYSHVYGAVFSGVQIPRQGICAFLLPNSNFGSGGGWFYSIGRDRASFGYAMISTNPRPDAGALKRNLHSAAASFEPYSEILTAATIDHIESGMIPITYETRLVRGNILAVGDAAGMATNWTCMGVEPALRYGRLAAEIVAQAIRLDDPSHLKGFKRRWLKENGSKYDHMNRLGLKFWLSGHDTWEWIMKNDLPHLTPVELLGRLRSNDHLMNLPQALLRNIAHKIRSTLKMGFRAPHAITVSH